MNSTVLPQIQQLLTQATRLGEAYETLLHEEDRGRFGIFYTHPIEAEFICRQAVVEYLIANTKLDTKQALSFVYVDQTSAPSSLSNLSIQKYDQIQSSLDKVKVCDPTCGSGVFLVEMLKILCELHKRLCSLRDVPINNFVLRKRIAQKNLFGMDIQSWAISIAELKIWLALFQGCPTGNLESFSLLPSLEHNLHVGDSLLESGQRLGSNNFDIIIGNPPYVRQEDICPSSQLLKESLKPSRRKYIDAIHSKIQEVWADEFIQDLRYDLYVYFFFRGLSMLKPGGVLALLTSNAWLDAQYGIPLRRFLLRNSLIKEIFENRIYRSFSQADINTVITILQRSGGADTQENLVKFVALRSPLQNVMNFNSLQTIKQAQSTILTRSYRCYPIRQINLLKKGNQGSSPLDYATSHSNKGFQTKDSGFKWGGTCLRAPDVYLRLINDPPQFLKRIGDFGSIHRGLTTGANAFFYVTAITNTGPVWTVKNGHGRVFKIERTYLHPLIKGPEKINRLDLDQFHSDYYALMFPPNIPSQSHAHSYVQWGEQVPVKIKKGLHQGQIVSGYHSLASFQNKRSWYTLTNPGLTHFAIPKAIWSRHFVAFSRAGIMLDQRIYGLFDVPETVDLGLLGAALNSSLTYLSLELNGRTNLGQGILDLATTDVKESLIVDPTNLTRTDANALRRAFRAMQTRSIGTLDDEMKCLHRKSLDTILLRHIGLSSDEIKDIRLNLQQTVVERLLRAGSLN